MSEKEQLEIINGVVEKVIYQNTENGYTVLSISQREDEITAVGIMPDVNKGEELELSGNYSVHSTYGPQFKVSAYAKILPKDAAAVLKYLSSGVIYGIGPSTAKKIVRKFGDNALDIMENNPEELSKINGITLDRAKKISAELKNRQSIREIIARLAPFGINADEAIDVYKQMGNDAPQLITENPYLLCGDKIGFDFSRVDELARKLDISYDCTERISAGVLFVLNHNLLNGHTCLPRKKLCEVTAKMLECNEWQVDDNFEVLKQSFAIKSKEIGGHEFIYLTEYYLAEQSISQKLHILKTYNQPLPKIEENELSGIGNQMGITLEELQAEAVRATGDNAVLIITGGPGTGKTTTLNAIIKIMQNRGLKIALAAPTGRAAKRMTELTGMESKTVHRLLEVEWDEAKEKHIYKRNERNPLDCDVLIVDELSMTDTLLFESLLRALRLGCRLVLVGDCDQLPSVGAGNILHDLIDSGTVKSISLKKVFRQALESLIIKNAHSIVNGETPDLDRKDADFFMIERQNPVMAAKLVVDLFAERLPSAYGFDLADSMQILCPSKKMQLGTVNLNGMLQQRINPPAKNKCEVNFKGITLREGDKVMQIKNNYDILWQTDDGVYGSGVFNGDIGVLDSIDIVAHTVNVRFDNKVAAYSGEEIGQLELAYAVTVHKSQGSEFDCVILPVLDVPYQLRYRNLLYTAVTRAKKMLVIVGSKEVVFKMVANDRKTLRYTGLKTFLTEAENSEIS